MNKFRDKWQYKSVEDMGSVMSKEAKQFVSDFKRMLKRELEPQGIEILSLSPNHYDCSGFLKQDGKYIYISYSIPRYGEIIDFSASGALLGVLYRTALNERDFTGGHNNFSSLDALPKNIINMFDDYMLYDIL